MPDIIETKLIGEGIVILRQIVMFGHPEICGCDAKCHKAFGINNRPKIAFDPKCQDDCAYLADHEVPIAPQSPGTWEGGDGKPVELEDRLNKWCIRECERSERAEPGEMLIAPDFSKRQYNQPWKHTTLKDKLCGVKDKLQEMSDDAGQKAREQNMSFYSGQENAFSRACEEIDAILKEEAP